MAQILPGQLSQSVDTAANFRQDVVSGTVQYLGEAAPNSLTSDPVWRVQRVTTSGANTTIEFASGGQFNQVWDNRASLTY